MLVLRYNFSLQLKAEKFFTKPVYYLPVDAVNAVKDGITNKIDEIYIVCYKQDNIKSALAILHLDSNLSIKHSFQYNYTGTADTYIEKPADIDIALNHNSETIYVAGGILGTDNITQNLLIKLDGNLNAAWTKTSASEHVMYNSVKQTGSPDYVVYTAGTVKQIMAQIGELKR